MGQRWSLQQIVLQQLDIHIKTDLTPFTKVNAKRIVVSDGTCNTVTVLEGNTGENLRDLRFSDNF